MLGSGKLSLTGPQDHIKVSENEPDAKPFQSRSVKKRAHLYYVECKSNLTDVAWQFVQTIDGNGNLQTVALPATERQRFYRFRRE